MQCFFEKADGERVPINQERMQQQLHLGTVERLVCTPAMTVVRAKGVKPAKVQEWHGARRNKLRLNYGGWAGN